MEIKCGDCYGKKHLVAMLIKSGRSGVKIDLTPEIGKMIKNINSYPYLPHLTSPVPTATRHYCAATSSFMTFFSSQ